MKKRVPSAVGIVVLALFLLVVAGCGKTDDSGKSEAQAQAVKIGVILPLTGSLSVLGQNEKRLLRISEKLINQSKGTTKLNLLIEDGASDPKRAATAANLFVSRDVPVIMTSTTPLSAPVVPIDEQNRRITVIHCMTEGLLKDTHLALRIYPGIQDEAMTIGQWLSKTRTNTSLFALRLDAEWSANWLAYFRKTFPGIPLHDEIYTAQNPSIRNALAKAVAAKPTHLLLLGFGQEYPTLLRQIKENGIELPIIGNIACSYGGTRQSANQPGDVELLANCVFPFIAIDTEGVEFKRLSDLYSETYNADILQEPGALYYYDALVMLTKAIDEVGLEPAAIRKQVLEKHNPYQGVTGRLQLSPDGNALIELRMARFDSTGKIRFLTNGR